MHMIRNQLPDLMLKIRSWLSGRVTWFWVTQCVPWLELLMSTLLRVRVSSRGEHREQSADVCQWPCQIKGERGYKVNEKKSTQGHWVPMIFFLVFKILKWNPLHCWKDSILPWSLSHLPKMQQHMFMKLISSPQSAWNFGLKWFLLQGEAQWDTIDTERPRTSHLPGQEPVWLFNTASPVQHCVLVAGDQ